MFCKRDVQRVMVRSLLCSSDGFYDLELRDGQSGPSCPRLPRAVAPSHRSSGCGQVRLRSAVASVLAAFEMPLWRRPTRLVPIHPDIVDNDVDIV